MASSVIHMAVASEVNKIIKRENDLILLGGIAPDLSKLVGESKKRSHFLTGNDDIPDIDMFLAKYKDKLNDDFVMGYFIHLYTDYLWFKYFIPEFVNSDKAVITKLNGEQVKCNGEMMSQYIYNDYTNLNIKLLDKYTMDLKIFYNEVPKIDFIIEEIPMDKLYVLVNKAGLIIENSKEHKDFVFNMENIEEFIKTSTELIIAKINEIMQKDKE